MGHVSVVTLVGRGRFHCRRRYWMVLAVIKGVSSAAAIGAANTIKQHQTTRL